MASSYAGLSSVVRGSGMDYLVWYTNPRGGSVEVGAENFPEALRILSQLESESVFAEGGIISLAKRLHNIDIKKAGS